MGWYIQFLGFAKAWAPYLKQKRSTSSIFKGKNGNMKLMRHLICSTNTKSTYVDSMQAVAILNEFSGLLR